MTAAPYTLNDHQPRRLGVVVLQTDETIEQDLRRLIPQEIALHVSRVPSALEVSEETLAAMAGHITASAELLPRGLTFDAVGYACTSGASVIGRDRVGALLRQGVETSGVTDPASALIDACAALNVRRLGVLTPYVPEVSDRLRVVLSAAGIETPILRSFNEPEEAKVARISGPSIVDAVTGMAGEAEIDAIFLSCTNLQTLGVIETIEAAEGVPVLSSNLVMAWRLLRLAGGDHAPEGVGALMRRA